MKKGMMRGSMQPYVWTINGASWGQHRAVTARSGERVVLSFHNMSMLGHPMHLHGHVFQVVGVNGHARSGAMRDTLYVPRRCRWLTRRSMPARPRAGCCFATPCRIWPRA